MKAVSNSSVLIALSLIEQLDLLPRLYTDGLVIAQAVWSEVVETGAGGREPMRSGVLPGLPFTR